MYDDGHGVVVGFGQGADSKDAEGREMMVPRTRPMQMRQREME